MLARKALAGTAGAPKLYVEDVMSCFLYTGNGSTQTITNGIDLSGEGGLTWFKSRNFADDNYLIDSVRGVTKVLISNSTAAQATNSNYVTGYNNNGFGIEVNLSDASTNYASWTFRKAKKFFDVVTFNADLSKTNQRISHNLGSVPGTIIIKCTNVGGSFSDWWTYHRSLGRSAYLTLNSTTASTSSTNFWGTSDPTSTDFGFNAFDYGLSSGTYVAYLFAHDAGGFGASGSDNVITCGSYTGTTSSVTVNLGWEPQWILIKRTDDANDWFIQDNMRGIATGGVDNILRANTTAAEISNNNYIDLTSTGFTIPTSSFFGWNTNGATYIYIAIRRGPMKTPTSGTSVYQVFADGATTNPKTFSVGFPTDFGISQIRATGAGSYNYSGSRLTGNPKYLVPQTDAAEATDTTPIWTFDLQNSFKQNISAASMVTWLFQRAPGFFDVVCYTGTGSATTQSHNLGVVPELVILKRRNSAENWPVLQTNIPTQATLNGTFSGDPPNSSYFGNGTSYVAPTSTVFSVGTNSAVNASGGTYVAYLFASLSGVSKVGSYTGNGSSVTVTTNFQPRFILVKRTDSTGNWIVGDSARGLVSADEPALFLNSTAAETTGQDWVDVSSTGFTVNETALNANVNTGTYIYLAIA